MRAAMLLLFLSLLYLHASAAVQELHAKVHEENARLAHSLQHYPSPLPLDLHSAPSAQDPFSFASVRILSAHPSVSNEISSLRPPEIFWVWGESHAPRIRAEKYSGGKCGPDIIELTSLGEAKLGDAKAIFSTPKKSQALAPPAGSLSFNTPLAPSDLDLEPWKSNDSNKSAPLYLNVTLSATISAPYSVYEMEPDYVCTESCGPEGCSTTCGCVQRSKSYRKEFKKTSTDSRLFPIQGGTPTFLLSSPPLGYALPYNTSIELLVLASRVPLEISLQANSDSFASYSPYSYSISEGQLGEALVNRTPNENPSISLSAHDEERHTSLAQLGSRNSSRFYLLLSRRPFPPGRANLQAQFSDEFGDSFNSSFPLTLRLPLQLQEKSNTALANSNSSSYFPGSDTALPHMSAFPPQPNRISLAALWPILALIAALFSIRALPKNA